MIACGLEYIGGMPDKKSLLFGMGMIFPLSGNGCSIKSLLQPNFSIMRTIYFFMKFAKMGFFSPTDTHNNCLNMTKYVKSHQVRTS